MKGDLWDTLHMLYICIPSQKTSDFQIFSKVNLKSRSTSNIANVLNASTPINKKLVTQLLLKSFYL